MTDMDAISLLSTFGQQHHFTTSEICARVERSALSGDSRSAPAAREQSATGGTDTSDALVRILIAQADAYAEKHIAALASIGALKEGSMESTESECLSAAEEIHEIAARCGGFREAWQETRQALMPLIPLAKRFAVYDYLLMRMREFERASSAQEAAPESESNDNFAVDTEPTASGAPTEPTTQQSQDEALDAEIAARGRHPAEETATDMAADNAKRIKLEVPIEGGSEPTTTTTIVTERRRSDARVPTRSTEQHGYETAAREVKIEHGGHEIKEEPNEPTHDNGKSLA